MSVDLFLSCIADPSRRQILEHLRNGACVNDLVNATGLTQSNISHHLARLRSCGLVAYDRVGKENHYRIAHPAVTQALDAAHRAADALPMCEVC